MPYLTPEPLPPDPKGQADVTPDDGPQNPDLDNLDDQAEEVDEQLRRGEG